METRKKIDTLSEEIQTKLRLYLDNKATNDLIIKALGARVALDPQAANISEFISSLPPLEKRIAKLSILT